MWKRFWRLSRAGVFEAFFEALAALSETADFGADVRTTIVRAHVSAAGAKGAEPPSAGPLARRLLTKIHLKTDWDGDPLVFCLTGGEASDSPHFETLLDLGPDITPRAAVGDKGYDAKANRQAARSRGICPAIPYRKTTKEKPTFVPKALYRGRARIEQTMGKLKRFKRVALRCEKTDENYASFVALALSFILIKSVHTT